VDVFTTKNFKVVKCPNLNEAMPWPQLVFPTSPCMCRGRHTCANMHSLSLAHTHTHTLAHRQL